MAKIANFSNPVYFCPTKGVPFEFYNGSGAEKKLEWCLVKESKKFDDISIHVDIKLALGGQIDRFAKMISCSACIACWCRIKIVAFIGTMQKLQLTPNIDDDKH